MEGASSSKTNQTGTNLGIALFWACINIVVDDDDGGDDDDNEEDDVSVLFMCSNILIRHHPSQ